MNELSTAEREKSAVAPTTSRSESVLICPVDLSVLPEVKQSGTEDVVRVVTEARVAQRAWRERSLDDRIATLKKAANAMLARRHEVMELVRTEIGKVDAEALFNEALGPLDTVNAWAGIAQKHTRRETVRLNPISFLGKKATIDLLPRGVVGIIAPWNFPVAGLYRAVIPALMTGNAVVLKPSPYSPRSSAWLLDVLASVLPMGLVAVVHGDAAIGSALIDSGIDACVFTGSPEAGKKVRVRCAELGIPLSAEMGGKDPAIILADCDMKRTIAGVTAWALANAGQACGAIEIAYVENTIADEFVSKLSNAWTQLRAQPGSLGEVDVAPLANRRQFDLVAKHVADAVSRGAKIACGGQPTGEGLWFQPTVLDHCTSDMLVVRDETFGPVLAVVRVDSASQAIALANESRYGLGASIWTRDIARAERMAERLECGVVNINNHSFSGAIPDLPWSGTRGTGHGIANSRYSLMTFCRPKATLVDHGSNLELYWMPYDRAMVEFGDILCDVQRGVVTRAWQLPLLLRKRMKHLESFFAKATGSHE